MADIRDVIAVDQEVDSHLTSLSESKDPRLDIYYSVLAICRAIQAVGIRLDYVIRDCSGTTTRSER